MPFLYVKYDQACFLQSNKQCKLLIL